jgi:tRNA pseudouridine55 synthase
MQAILILISIRKMKPNLNKVQSGLVFVDKPAGLTSHDVVAKLRRRFGTRRVGHGGTLDPMATGLLIIGIENGTKLLQFVTDAPKSYTATVRLGESRITDDAEGELIKRSAVQHLTDAEIEAVFATQVGQIQQKPSAVSAIKQNGVRAYARVRAGESVDLPARSVLISRLSLTGILRTEEFIDVKIEVDCSKGTYIRSIARDVGDLLKVGGHLTSLRRSSIGQIDLSESSDWEHALLQPLVDIAEKFMPTISVSASEVPAIKVGKELHWPVDLDKNLVAVAVLNENKDQLLAIGKPVVRNGEIKLGYHSVLISENL